MENFAWGPKVVIVEHRSARKILLILISKTVWLLQQMVRLVRVELAEIACVVTDFDNPHLDDAANSGAIFIAHTRR